MDGANWEEGGRYWVRNSFRRDGVGLPGYEGNRIESAWAVIFPKVLSVPEYGNLCIKYMLYSRSGIVHDQVVNISNWLEERQAADVNVSRSGAHFEF